MKEKICLLPSSELFCTNTSVDTERSSTSTYYYASSSDRRSLGIFSPPVMITQERVRFVFDATDFRNDIFISFYRSDNQSSSKMYSGCIIVSVSTSFVDDSDDTIVRCSSCEICDNGVDLKYDCSNANGTLAFSNVTNTTVLVPGPKVDTCIPIADVIPSF